MNSPEPPERSPGRRTSARALQPVFSPTTTAYDFLASLLAQETTATATLVDPAASLEIEAQVVDSGVASFPIPLVAGTSIVDLEVQHPAGFSRTYHVNIDRGGAVISQGAYGKASNAEASDRFAYSLAASADTIIVGAPGESSAGTEADNSRTSAGAAYVFRQSGGGWLQEAYLKPELTGAGDEFGFSVAIAGDLIVVGAPAEDSGAAGVDGDAGDNSRPDAGAVYVFRRTGSTWSQEAYVKPGIGDAGDKFGYSVAISGESFVVGAPYEDSDRFSPDSNGVSNSGAVYVFVQDGPTWAQQQVLKPNDTEVGASVGWSVSIDGDVAAIGAPFEHSNATGVDGNALDSSMTGAGAVYIFRRAGSAWSQEAYLKASNTRNLGAFGWSVAVSGNAVAVSSPAESSSATGIDGNQASTAAPGAGAVYVFRKPSANWLQEAYIKASNTADYDNFGWSLALSGDMLAVGAPGEDSSAVGVGGNQASNLSDSSGAAYVFRRGTTTWSQAAYVKASNTGDGDKLGEALALSRAELVVGTSNEDSAATGINGNQSDNSARAPGVG